MKIIPVRTASDVQSEVTGRALSRAFYKEPNFPYIFPDENRRAKSLEWFFGRFVARLGILYGKVYVPENQAGGAIWMSPGQNVNFFGAIRAGFLNMLFKFSVYEMKRSMILNNHIEQIREEYAPVHHWYLMALGVDPDLQGQGIGRLLMEPVLSQAEEEEMDCYLETFSHSARKFYEKCGFKVIEKHRVPRGGPLFWSMSRKSKT